MTSTGTPTATGVDGAAPTDGTAEAATETKGERTRRRLLEIAIERFGERGYRATSVSEIAREAGLTQAAVYAYFDSKDALFDAAVDADAAQAIADATDRAEGTDARQLVPMLLILLLGSLDGHPLLKRVLGGLEPEALQRLIELPALSQLTELIAEEVEAAQARGDVRADLDARVFADGSESILLSLLMSVVQVGQTSSARRQLGVLTIFDAVLRPPT